MDMKADWLSVCEAREVILQAVSPLSVTRRTLLETLGYVLAEDVRSPIDLPLWDNSGMDGFAVRASDIQGASEAEPHTLSVVEDIPAGSEPTRSVGAGEAARVMTGAPVPEGVDSVVRVEHTDGGTEADNSGMRVRILSDQDATRNIRKRGEDLRTGQLVLSKGTVLRAAEIGVAASLGHARLAVVRRPTVAILASGNELVDVDEFSEVREGRKIVSSNTYSLAAQLQESGVEPRILGIARDSAESLRDHLEAARGCNALITTAGVSMGEHDLMRDVLVEMGTRIEFWRVRMRPGSPLAFGWVEALGGIPWFGLPGNPVSTMVTFELFVRPAMLRMCGRKSVFLPTLTARMRDGYPASPGLMHFPRARLHMGPGNSITASLTGPQGSGILTSMAAADALLVIPEDRHGAAPGDELTALVLGGSPLQDDAGY